MLNQLLALLEQQNRGASVTEISRALGAQPDAVAGMLELLVRKGRVLEIGAANSPCATCKLESECHLLTVRATRYLPARQVCFVPEPITTNESQETKDTNAACPHCANTARGEKTPF